MIPPGPGFAGACALALLLAGRGGSSDPAPPPVQHARADVLATAAGGIDSIAFDGGIAPGECGLAREDGGAWPLRAPSLRMPGSSPGTTRVRTRVPNTRCAP